MTEFSGVHQRLVARVPLEPDARLEAEVVAYAEREQTLEGYAVHDAAVADPKPAVIVLHDWTGLREYPRARAQMLARLGYFAFAADLYGTGRRFDDQKEAAAEAGRYYGDLPLLRERVRAAYDVVAADPRVDETRIVVIGYCFGGSAALEFARTGADLAGTVSFHGGLQPHDPADVTRVKGSLLILTGGADPVVPDAAVTAFADELRTRPDLDWQITVYSGAPHSFTLPETPAYREVADRRSWRALTSFLEEVFTR
ncbi:dienelactone hydrolase [Actinocorallia herbida]|uniref:Dienelactone hydrolase n=1 Tax=Actinocorallia herbida TaxID=58109 RepID=A0A3N1D020_9ACTN|nr:dienelactone hydrolase family protein [Actinocorallia herbida]ROO86875.1 dienelactone hydrolase [Actinocorallia herbida]